MCLAQRPPAEDFCQLHPARLSYLLLPPPFLHIVTVFKVGVDWTLLAVGTSWGKTKEDFITWSKKLVQFQLGLLSLFWGCWGFLASLLPAALPSSHLQYRLLGGRRGLWVPHVQSSELGGPSPCQAGAWWLQ